MLAARLTKETWRRRREVERQGKEGEKEEGLLTAILVKTDTERGVNWIFGCPGGWKENLWKKRLRLLKPPLMKLQLEGEMLLCSLKTRGSGTTIFSGTLQTKASFRFWWNSSIWSLVGGSYQKLPAAASQSLQSTNMHLTSSTEWQSSASGPAGQPNQFLPWYQRSGTQPEEDGEPWTSSALAWWWPGSPGWGEPADPTMRSTGHTVIAVNISRTPGANTYH